MCLTAEFLNFTFWERQIILRRCILSAMTMDCLLIKRKKMSEFTLFGKLKSIEWKGDYYTEIEKKIKCVNMCKCLIRWRCLGCRTESIQRWNHCVWTWNKYVKIRDRCMVCGQGEGGERKQSGAEWISRAFWHGLMTGTEEQLFFSSSMTSD